MAEVRLKIGYGVYRLFLRAYKHSSEQAKNAIRATRTLKEPRYGDVPNDRDVPPRLTNRIWQPAFRMCPRSVEIENSRSFSKHTVVAVRIGRCYDLVSKCNEGGFQFWSAWRNVLPDSEHVRLHDKDSAGSCCFLSAPTLTDSWGHGVASRASCWRSNLVEGTTNQIRCEPRRYLCTVRFVNNRHSTLSLLQSPERLFVRPYCNNLSEPLYKSKTAYYDILDVSPTATHAQIKTAYYKQSFIYHPDKNAGSAGATHRFSNISEAYNVLGNKALRKKYDRGLLSHGDVIGATKPSSKDSKSSVSQPTRDPRQSSVLGIDSKKIFDFDRFIKSHYKSQLLKEEELRARKEELMRKKESMKDQDLGKMIAVGGLVVIALSVLMSLKQGGI